MADLVQRKKTSVARTKKKADLKKELSDCLFNAKSTLHPLHAIDNAAKITKGLAYLFDGMGSVMVSSASECIDNFWELRGLMRHLAKLLKPVAEQAEKNSADIHQVNRDLEVMWKSLYEGADSLAEYNRNRPRPVSS